MWLKGYLDFGPERALWALVADDILARTVTKDCAVAHRDLRYNPFLQGWRPKVTELCADLRSLVRTANKYGLRVEGLAFSREILVRMPMWYHIQADRTKIRRLASSSKASACLRMKHKIFSVEEFLHTATMRNAPEHRQKCTCMCNNCVDTRHEYACDNPDACFERAKMFLDTLPPKWDPRVRQPEDWEDAEHEMTVNECATIGDNLTPFDRRVSVKGELGEIFRIFTCGEVSNLVPDTQLQEVASQTLTIATDGSCLNNGQTSARAGAGVYVEDGHALNRTVRLPCTLAQSNQTGEVVAALVASQ
ncbi:hypothetical protein C8Q80DRAFT_1115230, partial [Daedaleopsis nitida]